MSTWYGTKKLMVNIFLIVQRREVSTTLVESEHSRPDVLFYFVFLNCWILKKHWKSVIRKVTLFVMF